MKIILNLENAREAAEHIRRCTEDRKAEIVREYFPLEQNSPHAKALTKAYEGLENKVPMDMVFAAIGHTSDYAAGGLPDAEVTVFFSTQAEVIAHGPGGTCAGVFRHDSMTYTYHT